MFFKIILILIVSFVGAYMGQAICKEPITIWWSGGITMLILNAIMYYNE